MINKIRWQITILLFVVIFPIGQLLAQSSDEAYQKYVAAYKQYQSAVDSQLSKAEIDKAVGAYNAAKAAYATSLSSSKSNTVESNSTETQVNSNSNAQTANFAAVPALVSSNLDASSRLASYAASLPADLKPLINILQKTTSKDEAKSVIASLEKYIDSNPSSSHKSLLQYEIASSLDRLNIDTKKAEALFTEVSKTPGKGAIASWAKLGLNYLKGKQYKAQWQTAIAAKFAEMTSAFAKYKNTSWLAFPVKAFRGTSYLSKSASFLKGQSDFADFMLVFEAAQAPFLPDVETLFDKYQAVDIGERADDNTRIRLIYNNYFAWYARWKIINEARSSLDVQYFIVENDAFGLGLLGLCLKKANEGVKIRLMLDVRGSNKLSLKLMAKGYLEELAKLPNVEVKIYNPFETNLLGALSDLRRMVSSNHDKILIADSRYSIIGGRNIADEYLVDAIDDPKAWRDTDVLIDSTLVSSQLRKAFDDEFDAMKSYEVGKSLFGMTKYRTLQMQIGHDAMDSALNLRGPLPLTKKFSSQADIVAKLNTQLAQYKNMRGYPGFELTTNSHVCPVHILDNHSLSGPRKDITENIVKYIDASRCEIIIQNPYVVLTPRAEAALKRAAKRGVPILVHTNSPQTSDSFPTEAMLYRDWRNILKDMPTMRIFARVNEGQLHGKNFVFDGKVGVVGTYNFDFLSEKVNSEVVAVVKSSDFPRELRNEIVFDIKKSVEYHLATSDKAEFGPGNVENPQKLWLIKLISKMGWLKPLF